MTEAQSAIIDDAARESRCHRIWQNGFVPSVGTPWFADTTREPIWDETIGDGFLPVRAIIERQGIPTAIQGAMPLKKGSPRRSRQASALTTLIPLRRRANQPDEDGTQSAGIDC